MGSGETLKRRKSQRLAGKKVLKERNGSQTEVGHISCWRYILAANYGIPATHHLRVFIMF